MVLVQWNKFPQSDIATYQIKSVFAGFSGDNVNLSGLTLEISLDGEAPQIMTFSNDILKSFREQIDGGKAYIDFSKNQFTFRSNNKSMSATVEVSGGTAVPFLNLQGPYNMSSRVLGLVENSLGKTCFSFYDRNGSFLDHYIVEALDEDDNILGQTLPFRPLASEAPVCVLEGVLYDISGVAAVDREIKVSPSIYDERMTPEGKLVVDPRVFMSRANGFFSLPLLRCATVHLAIPSARYSGYITIPDQDFVFLNDLLQTEKSKYLNNIII